MPYREPHNQDELDSSGSLLSRICKKCGIRKTPEEFYFNSDKIHKRRTCKRCAAAMRKANLASKPSGEWEEHLRKRHLRAKYGISVEEFYKLLRSQEGQCSICRVDLDSTTRQNVPKKVQVDHDHKTGQVRGLLCFSCNTGLGKFRDSEKLLHSAIAYLKDPPNVQYRDKFLGERERHHSKIAAQRMVEECPETIPRAPREHPRFLSPEEKALIREEYLTGEVTQRYLSIRWGCHSTTISMITTTGKEETMERNLVSVATITSLTPIEGADRIETARVRGWNVVVGKGSHSVGDKIAYFEIDSALPVEKPEFAQFADRGVKKLPDGTTVHVLKTIRLRGQISQGLVMSLHELGVDPTTSEDTRLDEIVGVEKWEPPQKMVGSAAGTFLTQYAEKTDSERVQNLSAGQWERVSQKEWTATEKVDGTSVTAVREGDGTLRVCSRNLEVKEDSTHFRHVLESGLADLIPPGMTVQGEIVGPGIQGNPLRLNTPRILLFDIWVDRQIVPRFEWPEWAKERCVPVLHLPFPDTVDEAVKQVDGLRSSINPDVQAEGVVWHTKDGSTVDKLGRSTFKAINNTFLLKSK